jgi:hypothetical protein
MQCVKDTDTPTACSLCTPAGQQPPHPPALLGTAAVAAPRGGRGPPPPRRPTSCSPNAELGAGWIWPVRGEKGRGEICGRCGPPCYAPTRGPSSSAPLAQLHRKAEQQQWPPRRWRRWTSARKRGGRGASRRRPKLRDPPCAQRVLDAGCRSWGKAAALAYPAAVVNTAAVPAFRAGWVGRRMDDGSRGGWRLPGWG